MSLRPIGSALTAPQRRRAPRQRIDPAAPVVIYVEDSAENWEVTQLRLRRHFRLLWARGDEEACALIRTHRDELTAVLMDIELQGSKLNGVELTRLLRGTMPSESLPDFARNFPKLDTPVFFVTAYGSSYSEDSLLSAGGTRVIGKPVDFAELSLALTQVKIASMPSMGARVAVAANETDFSAEALVRLIAEDPEFTARVMRLSHHEAFRRTIVHEHHTLEELDADLIRDIAVTLAVVDLIPDSSKVEDLLTNTLRRAVACYRVGQLIGLPASHCFALGMMLECGLLIRAQHDLPGALMVARMPAMARSVQESAAGEGRHSWRGAQMARDWELPDEFVAAVERHHGSHAPGEPYAKVAWLSECIAGVFEAGDHRSNQRRAVEAARQIEMAETKLQGIVERLGEDIEAAADAIGRPVGNQPPLSQVLQQSNPSLQALFRSYQDLVEMMTELIAEKDALAECLRAGQVRLAEEAATDALTKIANRRAFEAALQSALIRAAHMDAPLALILLDLDRFKRVNDQHGHQIGDAVLRVVGEVIREGTRDGDFAARYGGEEFAVILHGADRPTATMVAERIRIGIDATTVRANGGDEIGVTASFGVALAPSPVSIDDGSSLIAQADAALYRAKEAGRNRVIVAD